MKAMVLAAGRGERMGVLTDTTPKPLLCVAGKPLLQHHIERLARAGFYDIVVNASYLADQVVHFVEQLTVPGVHVVVSVEPERLETGGGIHNALSLLGDQPFLVVNGDVWTDYPLERLPKKVSMLAHLVLVPNPIHNPAGDFALQRSDQTSIVLHNNNSGFTFSGISLLSPQLFKGCNAGCFPLAPLLNQAIARQQVSGELYQGQWADVGTPERLRWVEQQVRERMQ